MNIIKIHISSCVPNESDQLYSKWLKNNDNINRKYSLVDEPCHADSIIVCDVSEYGYFENLRNNKAWFEYPEKAFVLTEIDNPPFFMRGIYSSAKKSQNWSGRFAGGAYLFHQICFPNHIPDDLQKHCFEKKWLYSFVGRNSHKVRKELFRLPHDPLLAKVIDTTQYNHFDLSSKDRCAWQLEYWKIALSSKYALCPRGAGTSSVRLFEMMEAGIAPVIISDDWLPPYGPKWDEFALFVKESEINTIPALLKQHEDEFLQRGNLARKAWEEYFSPEKYFDFIVNSILEIKRRQKIKESIYRRLYYPMLAKEYMRRKLIRAKIYACIIRNALKT